LSTTYLLAKLDAFWANGVRKMGYKFGHLVIGEIQLQFFDKGYVLESFCLVKKFDEIDPSFSLANIFKHDIQNLGNPWENMKKYSSICNYNLA
jgi:hypothetical protein